LKKRSLKKDLEILKYHYSYGICKGTNLETFEKNHSDAKAALKKGNSKFYFLHEKNRLVGNKRFFLNIKWFG
jgi:hypothetical protein